jgi:hypothetical protein
MVTYKAKRTKGYFVRDAVRSIDFGLPNLPKLNQLLFPSEYKLLPNVPRTGSRCVGISELFELEFAPILRRRVYGTN